MSTKSNFKRRLKVIGGSLSLVVVVLIASAFSHAKFPKPSGSYSVGTFHLELADTLKNGRTLQVEVYYPASAKHKESIPYHPNPEMLEEDLNALYGVPKILIKKISRSKVPVKNQAKPALKEDGFPLLLFSHGYNGSRFQNSFLLPQLVSQGYIIISLEHTGSAAGTWSSAGVHGGVTPFDSITHNVPYSNREIIEWSDDQIFVLNTLEKMVENRSLPLELSIDFSKIGVFGHSFGGASSANTLIRDSRFKAGINLDGFYFGEGHFTGFNQPFMELRADNKPANEMTEKNLAEWKMDKEEYHDFLFVEWNKRLKALARGGYESYVLKGANHMSFSDFSLMFPFGFVTAPDREEHHEATFHLIRNFFDTHLKEVEGKPVPDHLKTMIKKNSGF